LFEDLERCVRISREFFFALNEIYHGREATEFGHAQGGLEMGVYLSEHEQSQLVRVLGVLLISSSILLNVFGQIERKCQSLK
jgi:hypothetical protein